MSRRLMRDALDNPANMNPSDIRELGRYCSQLHDEMRDAKKRRGWGWNVQWNVPQWFWAFTFFLGVATAVVGIFLVQNRFAAQTPSQAQKTALDLCFEKKEEVRPKGLVE